MAKQQQKSSNKRGYGATKNDGDGDEGMMGNKKTSKKMPMKKPMPMHRGK